MILLGTVLNAAAEEFLYRHTAIRALTDAMGVAGAVALTSVVFGLAHLTGNPGGWTGVLFYHCVRPDLRPRDGAYARIWLEPAHPRLW